MKIITPYDEHLIPRGSRLFPLRYLTDGSPCIVGTIPGEPDENGTAISVYLAEDGELAPMYPTPDGEDVWYEIKLGDYVVVYEYCCQDADVYICSYQIQYISDDCVHGVPVNL